jgi:hypothetical protein
MTFDDAMLIEEMSEAATRMGLCDQVTFMIEEAIHKSSTCFFRNRFDEGGIDHAIVCQLAIFKGLGYITEDNQYPGPYGRVGQPG